MRHRFSNLSDEYMRHLAAQVRDEPLTTRRLAERIGVSIETMTKTLREASARGVLIQGRDLRWRVKE